MGPRRARSVKKVAKPSLKNRPSASARPISGRTAHRSMPPLICSVGVVPMMMTRSARCLPVLMIGCHRRIRRPRMPTRARRGWKSSGFITAFPVTPPMPRPSRQKPLGPSPACRPPIPIRRRQLLSWTIFSPASTGCSVMNPPLQPQRCALRNQLPTLRQRRLLCPPLCHQLRPPRPNRRRQKHRRGHVPMSRMKTLMRR